MIWGYAPELIAFQEQPLVQAAERTQGADVLMRQAAYALFHQTHLALSGKISCLSRLVDSTLPVAARRVVVLAGAGNNGGDGMYSAKFLAQRGYQVAVLPTSSHLHERAAQAAKEAGVEFWSRLSSEESGDSLARLERFSPQAVIDAVIGIGATPPLREPARSFMQSLARSLESNPNRPLVVACDHPSGLELHSGSGLGAFGTIFHADLTVTMGAPKTGMLVGPGSETIGHLEVQRIGLPLSEMTPDVGLVTREDVEEAWPWPCYTDNKYSRGVLSVLAGTKKYPGAAVLVVTAALHSGVAFLRYLGEETVHPLVLAAAPEVVLGQGRHRALVMGPGFDGHDEAHAAQILRVWSERTPDTYVVLDAGALSLVGGEIQPDSCCVLTPHAGEAASLAAQLGFTVSSEEIAADPLRWSRKLAEATHATVLLKGPTTTIATPQARAYSVTHGTSDLATAGSGDVLAGILGFLLASTHDIEDLGKVAALGAWVHGEAGRLAGPTPRATQIVKAISQVVQGLNASLC